MINKLPNIISILQKLILKKFPIEYINEWLLDFLMAVNVGSDLSEGAYKFVIWLVEDEEYGIIKWAKTNEQEKIIKNIIYCYKKNIIRPDYIIDKSNLAITAVEMAMDILDYNYEITDYEDIDSIYKNKISSIIKIQAGKLLEILNDEV